MRLRPIALSCALTGALGLLALPAAPAWAGDSAASRTPISVSSPVTDNPYGAQVTITVTLGPALAGRRVTLYATPAGKARSFVAAGNVDAAGKWYPVYQLTRTTTFTAVFAGNAHHRRGSASRTLRAYARVTSGLSGYYKTSTSGNGTVYAVFHGTGTLTLRSSVAPDKHGECLEPETQQYDPGAGWDADTRYGCDTLNGDSQDTAPFALSRAVGDRYRIRGDYVRGSSDAANLSTKGPWLYFIVTR